MSPLPKIEFDTARFVERWHEGATMAQLGAEFGGSSTWAGNHCLRLGLRRNRDTGQMPGKTVEVLYVDHQKSTTWIAKRLGTSHSVIARLLRSRGVKLRKGGKVWVDKRAQCVSLRRQGFSYPEIAKIVGGLTAEQVGWQVRKVLGAGKRGVPPKVDDDQLLALWHQHRNYNEVARHAGVSGSTVRARLLKIRSRQPDRNTG